MAGAELDKGTVEKLTKVLDQSNQDRNQFAAAMKKFDDRLDKLEKGKTGKDSGGGSSYSSSKASTSMKDALSRIGDKQVFTTGLTDFIEESVRRYGGMIDYAGSDLENRASVAIKLQAEKLTEFALETERFIGSKSISMIFGNANDARKALAEIYDANSYYLNRIAEDYAESEDAGMEVMANNLIIQRALRINQKDFAGIIENQMASSKKVTTQVFEEIAFFAGEYANRTTASIFQITNQLTRAVADFDTFGGASVENLGKLAGFMGELKMDTDSVASLIQKMQSFEGSVSIVKDLAGAFGAVIDPAKLMGDAINDPAEALNTIRQSLLDAGHTSESLGFKITLLAKDLGVSSEAMRRFLNAEIDAQAVLENSVEASGMTAERTSKIVSDAQQQMVDSRSAADVFLDMANDAMEHQLQSSFKTVRQFQTDINQFLTSQGNVLNKLFGTDGAKEAAEDFKTYLYGDPKEREAAREDLLKMLDTDKFAGKAKEQAEKLRKTLEGEGEIDLEKMFKEVDKIKEEQGRGIEVKVNVNEDSIKTGLDNVAKSPEVQKFHDVLNEPFKYTRRQSPSPFEEDLKENMRVLDLILGGRIGPGSILNKFKEAISDLGKINVQISDEEGDLSLEEFKDKVAEFYGGVSGTSFKELLEEFKLMREEFKNTKYVANITNDGTYNVVLGDDFKTEVIAISDKVVEEAFKAAGLI